MTLTLQRYDVSKQGVYEIEDTDGADGGTRTRTLIEKQIFIPLRLSPPPFGVRGLDCPFTMARRL